MGVSVEDSATQAAMAEQAGLEFRLLSDRSRALISALGLRHEDGFPGEDDAIARPVVLIVRGGVIRRRFVPDNWRVRQDGAELVAALSKLP